MGFFNSVVMKRAQSPSLLPMMITGHQLVQIAVVGQSLPRHANGFMNQSCIELLTDLDAAGLAVQFCKPFGKALFYQ